MSIHKALGLVVAASLLSACAQMAVPPAASPEPEAAAPEPAAPPPPAPEPAPPTETAEAPPPPPDYGIYNSRADGDYRLEAVDPANFSADHLRERVPYETAEAPGTIVIETAARQLYLVEPEGMAMRYGVAIGAEGFGWTGEGTIARSAQWPRWTPPPAMIKRKPELAKWSKGMPGGPENPLGARALYIYFGEDDSGYRIHGTNEPRSIGRSASSGCFRMLNQDVVDLYERVERGAKVIVR